MATAALTVVPQSGVDSYRQSTDAAGICREIVIATASKIGGRQFVAVEGWQAIAVAHGCVASAIEVRRVTDEGCQGFAATGVLRRMEDGVEIGRAEGFVGDDEKTWGKRDVYARRAMAQTRAISRVCRSAFAHVVVMMKAGLQTTPAEEMSGDEHDDAPPRRENARDRARREAEANGGTHPNNEDAFDVAAETLRVEAHIIPSTDKADLDARWRETRHVRADIKRANPELHDGLVAKFAEIAKRFAHAEAAPADGAAPAKTTDMALDPETKF